MLRNIRALFNRYTTELKYIEGGFKNAKPTTFCYLGEFPDARKFLALVTLVGDDGFRAAVSISETTNLADELPDAKVMTRVFDLESYLESAKGSGK